MKAYPLDEFQLEDLGRIGTAAAFCFSVAGGCIGFGLNLYKDLSIATGVSTEIAATWGTIRWGAFAVGIMFALIGLYLFRTGHTRVEDIKKRTTFANHSAYTPTSWFPVVVRITVVAGLLIAGGMIGRFLI